MGNTKVSAGEIVHFTSGEYSCYGIEGSFVFCKNCDLEELLIDFAKEKKEEVIAEEYYEEAIEAFLAWLVINGWAVGFNTREVHLGAYGRLVLGKTVLDRDVENWPDKDANPQA